MFTLVTGGSGSGKSAFAENEILRFGQGKRIYVATMMSFDEESRKRIARHRRMRSSKEFETLECYTGLERQVFSDDSIVLLECMSNLVANEMYAQGGAGKHTVAAVLRGVTSLREQARHVCVVTNEIFSDGILYDEETRRYQQYLGTINQSLADSADRVVEVVYGIPLYLKGALAADDRKAEKE